MPCHATGMDTSCHDRVVGHFGSQGTLSDGCFWTIWKTQCILHQTLGDQEIQTGKQTGSRQPGGQTQRTARGSEDDIAFQKLHLMDLSKRGIGGCKRMTGQTQLKCEVHFLVVHLMTVCSCNPRRRKWCWQNWLVSPFWRQMCRWFAHCTGTIWGSVKPSWPKSLRCWSLFVLPAVLTTQGKLDVFFMMPC